MTCPACSPLLLEGEACACCGAVAEVVMDFLDEYEVRVKHHE